MLSLYFFEVQALYYLKILYYQKIYFLHLDCQLQPITHDAT